MDQARIEFYLDDGWNLVGRLHHWLSRWPDASDDRIAAVEIIRGLQLFWAMSEDLGIRSLARTSLALEQLLERICASTLEFTEERLNDCTMGVGCLQELLLGLEATREVPKSFNLDAILRMERHALQTDWPDVRQELTIAVPANDSQTLEISIHEAPISATVSTISTSPAVNETTAASTLGERPLLSMLERFAVKLDETCRRLHSRVVADEAPYVPTTSRLEHLAQVTRDLVDEIVQQQDASDFTTDDRSLPEMESQLIFEKAVSEFDFQKMAFDLDFAASSLERLKRESATFVDEPAKTRKTDVVEANFKSQRVLVVEDSLFFRNLISMVVQSAGHEPHTAESVERGIEVLTQSSDFGAILVGSMAYGAMSDAIDQCRRMAGTKVIGLIASEHEEPRMPDVDDHFVRSRPQQLTSILNRVLSDASDLTRKSA